MGPLAEVIYIAMLLAYGPMIEIIYCVWLLAYRPIDSIIELSSKQIGPLAKLCIKLAHHTCYVFCYAVSIWAHHTCYVFCYALSIWAHHTFYIFCDAVTIWAHYTCYIFCCNKGDRNEDNVRKHTRLASLLSLGCFSYSWVSFLDANPSVKTTLFSEISLN